MTLGYESEARAWREWLVRAVAGSPERMQIMYGPLGERRLTELELDWLPGYAGSRPVRTGNAASAQFQLDVFGEIADTLHVTRKLGLPPSPGVRGIGQAIVDFLEDGWRQPDDGIWEVHGPRRHFTHSKVMAWVAFDRAVKAATSDPALLAVDLDQVRGWRDDVRTEVLAQRVRRGPGQLRAVLRLKGARRQPAHDPARRVPAARRSPRGGHGSRRSSGS